jgi:hypothetical protein
MILLTGALLAANAWLTRRRRAGQGQHGLVGVASPDGQSKRPAVAVVTLEDEFCRMQNGKHASQIF